MKLAYYPGCSSHTTGKEYEISTQAIAKKFGIELVEIPDWNCCGATASHGKSHLVNAALPSRNLAKAEEMGLDVATGCAACYHQLANANKQMREDLAFREKVNQVTGVEYKGSLKVQSIVEVIGNLDPEVIKAQMVKPLKGLKVAAYYGCLLVRPPSVTNFDDPENPMFMDRLMSLVGAETVDWAHKTECCGASMSGYNVSVVARLVDKIMKAVVASGANCMVAACPLCHMNLDLHQKTAAKQFGANYDIPVFYFTELLALATGSSPEQLQLKDHFTDTKKVLNLVG